MTAPDPSPRATTESALRRTPLHALHLRLGARMVPFAGYEMPVQYGEGVVAEHRHCRAAAALFDVSHMGQIRVGGESAEAAGAALETLLPQDLIGLAPGQQRYAFFTNPTGGLLDDLMVLRTDEAGREAGFGRYFLVVNAACKEADLRHLVTHAGHRATFTPLHDRALLALQGPQAAQALERLAPATAELRFMRGGVFQIVGATCMVTRSGYTGEDGFEISVPEADAEAVAEALLQQPEVKPAGLGSRDTLRLEAGLCLYGQDIGPDTSPIEAGLGWAIQKVRRPGGERAGRYPGAEVIARHLGNALPCRRVGLVALERVPVRPGTAIVDVNGHTLGKVTSGTLTPTADKPIAMGYVPVDHAGLQHRLYAQVRIQRVPMEVVPMPFVPHRYLRA
jgi:aminomethyltransferase